MIRGLFQLMLKIFGTMAAVFDTLTIIFFAFNVDIFSMMALGFGAFTTFFSLVWLILYLLTFSTKNAIGRENHKQEVKFKQSLVLTELKIKQLANEVKAYEYLDMPSKANEVSSLKELVALERKYSEILQDLYYRMQIKSLEIKDEPVNPENN